MTRTIDAHQHFWRTAAQEQPWRTSAHEGLARDFAPDDLRDSLAESGIDGTVLIQSVDEPAENERLARYALDPAVAGVVAWVPLADATAATAVLEALEVPKLSGVRCLIARDPLRWLTDDAHLELFGSIAARGLAWDVVPVTAEQTEAVAALAERVPSLRIVVDHLGRPPIDSAGWEPWASLMRRLAACPNVAVKVSVGIDALTAWDGWDADALRPYVDAVLGWFGPDRSMLASNWPVVLLRTSHAGAWADLLGLVRASADAAGLDRDAVDAVRGGTATRWYRLPD